MAAEPELNGEPGGSEDLDRLVSSFLAELDVLSTELEHPPAFPILEKTLSPVEPAPENRPVTPQGTRLFSWGGSPESPGLPVLFSLVAVGLALSCWLCLQPARRITDVRTAPIPSPERSIAPISTRFNDTARLLAGLPVESNSSLYPLSIKGPFLEHRQEMRLFWNRILKENLAKMSRWREANIPARLEKNPVLYPLSGADFLNAYSLFPHAREYLLVSLESPGLIPDMSLLAEKEIDNNLTAIRHMVQSIASVNYLQSKGMREELTGSSFHGVVPLLLVFAAGFGQSIRDVHPVALGQEGLIPDAPENVPKKFHRVAGVNVPDGNVRGIQILFTDGAGGTLRSVTYLQIELKNEIFGASRPEGKFLMGLKNRNTMLKSAVYLLHGDRYSQVREFILGSSDLVIQDDSGIPYRSFLSSEWEEYLFGTYTRPQPLGTILDPPPQPLLAERYASASQPLAFPYGYGALWGKDRSNLMLFVKK
jgi:hypothetical protein